MAQKRPLTVREIQASKVSKHKDRVIILNTSKQLVPIHLRSPRDKEGKRVDFYVGARDVRLRPGQKFEFNKDLLWDTQVDRLQKQGKIQVIYDSEKKAIESNV